MASAFEIKLDFSHATARCVAGVERRLSFVEELDAVVSAKLQRAVQLRQSVLQKAFSRLHTRSDGQPLSNQW